ncbi:O-acetylhomoserine/O-acetylserine sulfhydrylase [alpha proteobacterium BAL199]|jgi:O-acetylhomoserine (thiol)-lyase|nr:O-acetylhomoserine/O-acetylserine sulfhydrylase [alpha proteobacterium BAL199]
MAEIDPTRAVVHDAYSDDYIRDILRNVKTIAMVGASDNWNRPSYFAMKYLQQKGYRVFPVNPKVAAAGGEILGEKAYADLKDLPETADMVDVFRNSAAAGPVTDAAIEHGTKVVWMQLGVRNDEAAERAEKAGIQVVMNRCPKIEFSRLFGELGWHGFNSRVISSKRRTPGSSDAVKGDSDVGDGFIAKGFETLAVHAGAAPDPTTGARATPIYQTTAYVFDDVDHAASLFNLQTFGNIYSRLSNPTVAVLEERIAALEGGHGTTCTASGHSAQLLALFALMGPGDRFVASTRLYGGSITQFGRTFKKFDWHCDFVDVEDLDATRQAALHPKCKAIFAESLANPGGVITDMQALARIADEAGVPLIIDNTMATPYLCRPFEHGADIVVHSTTKFLSGHGNAMGGAVVDGGKFDWSKNDKFPSLSQPEPAYHGLTFFETFGDLAYTIYGHAVGLRDLGPTMAPMNAYLTITGIETLALRMERHVANAQKIAEWLNAHPKVAWVSYAGLPGNRYHELANRYLPKGAGSVFTFGVVGGYQAGVRAVERCRLLSHLANIGDTRSLILHPASTTHRQLTDEQRTTAGAGDDVIRLSIGLESAEDIMADLDRALG